jgi:hypothetical protein
LLHVALCSLQAHMTLLTPAATTAAVTCC